MSIGASAAFTNCCVSCDSTNIRIYNVLSPHCSLVVVMAGCRGIGTLYRMQPLKTKLVTWLLDWMVVIKTPWWKDIVVTKPVCVTITNTTIVPTDTRPETDEWEEVVLEPNIHTERYLINNPTTRKNRVGVNDNYETYSLEHSLASWECLS